MKKLLLGICIAVIFYSCGNNSSNENTNTQGSAQTPKPTDLSLNGYTYSDATKMVKNFKSSPGTYDANSRTSIWFSKTVFQGMFAMLISNKGNGIRIYLAKDSNQQNTIVVVLTKLQSGHPYDYFSNALTYSSDPSVNGTVNYNQQAIDNGAAFYSGNPNCNASDGCDPSNPHYLSCEKAYLMVTNYGSDKINITSEWFDKRLVGSLDTALLNNSKLDGIRVYFARQLHPDPNPKATPDTYRHCFVFVTTTGSALNSSIHIDQYICINLPKVFIKDVYDNGEQCPEQCEGTTWQ